MHLTTNRQQLAAEITGLDIRTDKFKTKRISLSFVLPLNETDASLASILAKLLSRSTAAYPDPVALHRKLLSLYGAHFAAGVIKVGDYQLLNMSITSLADRFALQKEPLSEECTEFLCQALFRPHMKDGSFLPQDFDICQRLLIESIESTINDKRKYAISQMYKTMCKNEPFGVELGGTIETASQITSEQVVSYWENMLKTAPVVITVVGEDSPAPIYETIVKEFENIGRNPTSIHPRFQFQKPASVTVKEETMQLAQGKLVMGFRSDISSTQQDNLSFRMMCDIFGGAPYSKLFTVVREKMSLCYYCAARIQSQKGFICVDSGVDSSNIDAAKEGILTQLASMQAGDFDRAVIEACKMSMADSAKGVTDTPSSIEAWYLNRLFDHNLVSPEEFIEKVAAITKDDLVQAAQNVVLDTVYVLKGQEGSQ